MARMLGISLLQKDLTVDGTPLGSAAFVAGELQQAVEGLVGTLLRLPLSAQTQLLLLRASLNVRMAHLRVMRTVPFEALDPHMCKAQLAVWRAEVRVMALPEDDCSVVPLAGPSLNVADPALCPLASRIMILLPMGDCAKR